MSTVSHSLVIGRSFLPASCKDIDRFVRKTASAIKNNPDCAADITLAATIQLIELTAMKTPPDLRDAFSLLVSESCKARDESTHA